jgi:hypothetical protein
MKEKDVPMTAHGKLMLRRLDAYSDISFRCAEEIIPRSRSTSLGRSSSVHAQQ